MINQSIGEVYVWIAIKLVWMKQRLFVKRNNSYRMLRIPDTVNTGTGSGYLATGLVDQGAWKNVTVRRYVSTQAIETAVTLKSSRRVFYWNKLLFSEDMNVT